MDAALDLNNAVDEVAESRYVVPSVAVIGEAKESTFAPRQMSHVLFTRPEILRRGTVDFFF